MFYTYLFIDPKTDLPAYVGKGRNTRWKDHFNPNCRSHIGNLIRKRTKEGYVVLPIVNMEIDEETALRMEMFWINQFGRKDLGTGTLLNLTDGGEGTSGMTPWNKGITPSIETKKKLSISLTGHPSKKKGEPGKLHNEETKKKMSKAALGKPKSEEAKRNMSLARQVSNNTLEYKQAHSERMKQWWALRKEKEAYHG